MTTTTPTRPTTTPARSLFYWTYVGLTVQALIAALSWLLWITWPDTFTLTFAVIWSVSAIAATAAHHLSVWHATRSYARLRAQYDREV